MPDHPRFYRVMEPDGALPRVGRGARFLGVRVAPHEPADVHPSATGTIVPSGEGMSVAPRLVDLPIARVPERLRGQVRGARGKDSDRVFRMGEEERFVRASIGDALELYPTGPAHAVVQPLVESLLADYELALALTRASWTVDEDGK